MSSPGYWPSPWPVECGGNSRPKVASSPGLDIQPTEYLVSTVRHTGRWPVMFVRRDHGELYLQGTTLGHESAVAGWVERVDPRTLEPIESSGDLPAGAHEWCGSIAVHANGDLYTVNGSYLHRLAPDCSVVSELPLPIDHAHNGLLILDDGSIITKDIRLGGTPSTLTVCDPDLTVLTTVLLPEASMGRIAAVGDAIYIPGTTKVFRYHWDGANLSPDPNWSPVYRSRRAGGLAWDPTIVGDRVWLMDNGNVPGVEARFSQTPTLRSTSEGSGEPAVVSWKEPIRAIGISVDSPEDIIELEPTQHPAGWAISPPLVHGNVLVGWDTAGMGVAAFDLSGPRPGEMLWFQPFRTSMQPLVYADTGELVLNDYRLLSDQAQGDGDNGDDLVVLDLHTGQMKARVPTGAKKMNGMFLTPGFERDVYYCTFDTVARISVASI